MDYSKMKKIDKTLSLEDRIGYLRYCAELYEKNGTSPTTDDEYDTEREDCRLIRPDHSFFSEVGGRLDFDNVHVYGTKVKHKYIMGSLEKDPNPELFGKWFKNTFGKEIEKVVAILQLKVDGSSFCLKYQDKNLIQAVSRGDGFVGIDYTSNAQYIRGVQKQINAQGYVEIKGEVYKNKQDFEKFCAKDFANDRNYTAGAINQKNPLITKERKLDFIAYEVRGINFEKESEKIQFLIDNGFETLKDYTSKIDCSGKTVEDIVNVVKNFMNKFDRNTLPFSVDGAVFKLMDISWAESLGTTDGGKRSKSSRAIKFLTEKAETILQGIEWNIGRVGSLTPVGLLKPTHLAGTTVKRVTLHNLKEMSERLGITRLGAKVVLEKRGDIIPKITSVISDGNGEKIKVPDECPSCGNKLKWDSTNTTKFCYNENCPSQLISNVEHFFKTIDVLGIGEGIITELVSVQKKVTCISDMYSLNEYKDELSEVFGHKAFENILTAVNSVRELSLAKFIEALGIGKVGTMAKDITAIAPTMKDLDNLKEEDIISIQGFGPTKAHNFVLGWKSQRSEIDKLLKHIKIKEVDMSKKGKKLEGLSFCITGKLSKTRDEYVAIIEENGGKWASGVSKSLSFLICGEDSGSKLDKANKLGIKILTEDEFNAMI